LASASFHQGAGAPADEAKPEGERIELAHVGPTTAAPTRLSAQAQIAVPVAVKRKNGTAPQPP
jgi:hypothetical protein